MTSLTTTPTNAFWNTKSRINQIVFTTNDGRCNVLFDEKLSYRGAKLCVAKKKRAQELTEMNVNINVVVPFQPKSFRETNKNQSKEAQFLKARKDTKLSARDLYNNIPDFKINILNLLSKLTE